MLLSPTRIALKRLNTLWMAWNLTCLSDQQQCFSRGTLELGVRKSERCCKAALFVLSCLLSINDSQTVMQTRPVSFEEINVCIRRALRKYRETKVDSVIKAWEPDFRATNNRVLHLVSSKTDYNKLLKINMKIKLSRSQRRQVHKCQILCLVRSYV